MCQVQLFPSECTNKTAQYSYFPTNVLANKTAEYSYFHLKVLANKTAEYSQFHTKVLAKLQSTVVFLFKY